MSSNHASPIAAKVSMTIVALLVLVGAHLGVTVNLAKLGSPEGIGPLAYTFWSALGGGVILLAIASVTSGVGTLSRSRLEYFFVAGLISIALPNALQIAAIPRVGAGFVALSYAFPPLFTYVFALIFGIERFRGARALGVLLGLFGAFLLAWSKARSEGADLLWIFAVLAAPVIIASGNVYRTLRWPEGSRPLSLAAGMLLGSTIPTAFLALVLGQPLTLPVSLFTIGLMATQAAVLASMYLFYFVLQRRAGPVYLSQIGSVGAVTGALLATLVYGEQLPSTLGPAALLIAAGVMLVTGLATLPFLRKALGRIDPAPAPARTSEIK